MTAGTVLARATRSPLAMPVAAAVAVLSTSTALSGVLAGVSWLGCAALAATMVLGGGLLLRTLRLPGPLIPVGQLVGLLCLTTALFTHTGVLFVLPGPAALHDLVAMLRAAVVAVRTGVPPVPIDASVRSMIVLSFGLVTIAVEALTVIVRAPAAAGLVLLCVYAVPASLATSLLPWWSFVAGVGSFASLLVLDNLRRHDEPPGPWSRSANGSVRTLPAAAAVAGVAVLLALTVGWTFTAIGTVGRLPGVGAERADDTGYLGIKPFTTLRGMLTSSTTTELFDVQGLPSDAPYLRALTASNYQPGAGWFPDSAMAAGVPASGPLPAPPGGSDTGPGTDVEITPVHWDDVWLPIFNVPRQLQPTSGGYHYDPGSGVVYSVRPQRPGPYREQAMLAEPTADELRAAGSNFDQIDQGYAHADQIDPRLTRLAQTITARSATEFDKAAAIYDYFRNPANGFTYSTHTAPPTTSDPIVDFVFNGKTGYCEQYASAMGALLRAVGVPVRIAIGFTDGSPSGDHQVITSHDAHAWDEVYFPRFGWLTFDPTPLTDGRTHVPTYLAGQDDSAQAAGAPAQGAAPQTGDAAAPAQVGGQSPSGGLTPVSGVAANAVGGWHWWMLGTFAALAVAFTALARMSSAAHRPTGQSRWHRVLSRDWYGRWLALASAGWLLTAFLAVAVLSWWLATLVVVLAVAAGPAGVRAVRRRQNLREVARHGPLAADAAWAEVLAESRDRGTSIPDSETARLSARRLVREHALDDQGRDSLLSLVSAVERSWYAPAEAQRADPTLRGTFDDVRQSLHRNAPLTLRGRLLPRSVLRHRRSAHR